MVWEASPLLSVSASTTNCSLSLGDDGDLVLSSSISGEKLWSTNTSGMGVLSLQLLESGNLVLLNITNLTIWQSFDSPTDTLLQGQAFKPGMQLTSAANSKAPGTTYSFAYKGLDAYLFASFHEESAVPYWELLRDYRSSSKPEAYIVFESGNLNWYANDLSFVALSNFQTLLIDSGIYMWRAKLGTDGNLQSYYWTPLGWTAGSAGQALTSDCQKPDYCGAYGICTGQGQCQCVSPSFQQLSSDPSQGCKPTEPLNCTGNITLVNLTGIDYFSNQFFTSLLVSSQECQRLCIANCSCAAAFYHNQSSSCYLIDNLRTMQSTPFTNTTAFVKVQKTSAVSAVLPPLPNGSTNTGAVIAASVGSILGLGVLCLALFWCYTLKKRKAEIIDDERFLQSLTALPPRFSYKEMVIATKKFTQKLGSGGFGSVYEGVLPDNTRVAVKQLERASGQGRKQFRAEIATIGCICHLNVVRLRGFCLESKHRLLVYEFMANGSLEKALFKGSDTSQPLVLGWDTRYQIALGTARGLAYLHEECVDRIIHCDIKPDNILLDDKNMAKLADFGLAKLVDRQESKVVTEMRGTRGYLAPEWLSNMPIGERTDVYSFGMVLLELVSGRKTLDVSADGEKLYLPTWAFSIVTQGRDFMELVDGRLDTHTVDEEQLRKLVEIGLWCIQEDMSLRPTMGVVVKTLEGLLEVLPPPIPCSGQR